MSPVGIDERDGNLSFSISNIMPNPFEGASAFKLQTPESGQVNIEICDMRGRKMATYEDELLQVFICSTFNYHPRKIMY